MINPNSAPADNGSVVSINATIAPITFAGTLNADLGTGEISVGEASPVDSYVISVSISDNCGATAEPDFEMDIVSDNIFSQGFE